LNFSYSATGTASGPYPGTFTENGSMTSTQLAASFTIDSPVGRVTGTKSGLAGVSCAFVPPCSGTAACEDFGAAFNTPGVLSVFQPGNTYQATITTATGLFADNGLFNARYYHTDSPPSSLDGFDEGFQSALEAPVPLQPTAITQCKKGGYLDFNFRNQGECVAFVQRGPGPGAGP
jgi:hypothetical protein